MLTGCIQEEGIDGKMKMVRMVSPCDLSFLATAIRNYYQVWRYDGLKERHEEEKGKDEPFLDNEGKVWERPETLYTDSKAGTPKLGGWNLEGRKVHYKLRKELVALEKDKDAHARMLHADQAVLKTIRTRNNCDQRDAKRNARKKGKVAYLEKKDDESDLECEDCLS